MTRPAKRTNHKNSSKGATKRPLSELAQERSIETRRRLILAAAGLFRDKGYKGTTLRDIADAIDMEAGSLYYYFDSKEELLHEILDRGIAAVANAVRDGLEALPSEAGPIARLREAIRAALHAHLDTDGYTTAYTRIYVQLPPNVKRRDHPRRLAYIAYWRQLVMDAQRAGNIKAGLPVDAFVNFMLGALSRTSEWHNPQERSIDELASLFADWILEGIAA